MRCSRCGKEIEDVLIEVNQAINVYKITENKLFIPTKNISEPTKEFLCKNCFDKYVDCLNALNEEYEKALNGANIVQVVDEVQYGIEGDINDDCKV